MISPGPTRWPPRAERRLVPAKSNLKPQTSNLSYEGRGRDAANTLPVLSVIDNNGFACLKVLHRCVPPHSHRVVTECRK